MCFRAKNQIILKYNYIEVFVFESYYVVQDKERNRGENPGFDKAFSWSALKDENGIKVYKAFQDAVDTIIEAKNIGITRLEFDLRYWDKARKTQKAKTRAKQIEEIRNIWKENEERNRKENVLSERGTNI